MAAVADDPSDDQISPAPDSHAPLVGSPKQQRHGDAAGMGVDSGQLENQDSLNLEDDDDADERQQSTQSRHRQRSTSGDDWLAEAFAEIGKLYYAPADLYIVYSIKVAECTAYYGFSYVYCHYLTEEFGMTDQEAGNLYAIYGLLCTVIGILMGVSIDRLGVRKAMIVGSVANTVARAIAFTTTSRFMMIVSSVVFAPLGAAFGVPSLALAVRRYTHPENRSLAFSFFYMALCLACVFSSIIINRIRAHYLDGVMLFGFQWSWMRLVILWCAGLSAYCIVASTFVRDIQVRADKPIDEEFYEIYKQHGRTNLREIVNQRRFWRVCGVTFIFCGVRMTFRHMDATFPKYFIRTHGRDAPFELVVGFEPLLTMFLAPIATLLIRKFQIRIDHVFLVGAFFSGISVFVLSVEETFNAAMGFVVVIALGEAIWSPKLYEFSTMAAPEGREGIFVAISFAPMYLASVPVGWLSGWALSEFCPRNAAPEERRGQLMWFIIGLTSFSSFVMLACCRHRLFPPEDAIENEDGSQDSGEL